MDEERKNFGELLRQETVTAAHDRVGISASLQNLKKLSRYCNHHRSRREVLLRLILHGSDSFSASLASL